MALSLNALALLITKRRVAATPALILTTPGGFRMGWDPLSSLGPVLNNVYSIKGHQLTLYANIVGHEENH
jgi:hypothetical protein